MNVCAWFLAGLLWGAGALGAAPAFEVASIKPCAARNDNGQIRTSPGRLRFDCITLEGMIRGAYYKYAHGPFWRAPAGGGLPVMTVLPGQIRQPVRGGEPWVKSERFEVQAKSEALVDEATMQGPMMRALLEQRFKLKVHMESQEAPVFQLTAAKGGVKLQAAKPGSCSVLDMANGPPPARVAGQPAPIPICGGFEVDRKNRGLNVRGVTMADLCMMLTIFGSDRDIVDKTGIEGRFDIHLDMSHEDLMRGSGRGAPAAPSGVEEASDPGGSLGNALGKLGLKLEKAKRPYDVVVIDRVERPSGQ